MRAPHSTATLRRVYELNEAGWTPTQMLLVLADEGFDRPSLTTIYLWLRPDYRERSRVANQRRSARRSASSGSFHWPARRSPEWKLARMRVLKDAGLSCEAVATVMTLDFPDTPLTGNQVDGMFRLGTTPRSLKVKVA